MCLTTLEKRWCLFPGHAETVGRKLYDIFAGCVRAAPLKLRQGLKKEVDLEGRNDSLPWRLPVFHYCKQTGVISNIHLHFSDRIIYCLSSITSFVMPGSMRTGLNVTHLFVCSCLTSIRAVYILGICKTSIFLQLYEPECYIAPFLCQLWPITPFCSLILREKSWALGKQQISVFSKCLRPSFPLHFCPFLP